MLYPTGMMTTMSQLLGFYFKPCEPPQKALSDLRVWTFRNFGFPCFGGGGRRVSRISILKLGGLGFRVPLCLRREPKL